MSKYVRRLIASADPPVEMPPAPRTPTVGSKVKKKERAVTDDHWHRQDMKTRVCPVCGRWP